MKICNYFLSISEVRNYLYMYPQVMMNSLKKASFCLSRYWMSSSRALPFVTSDFLFIWFKIFCISGSYWLKDCYFVSFLKKKNHKNKKLINISNLLSFFLMNSWYVESPVSWTFCYKYWADNWENTFVLVLN